MLTDYLSHLTITVKKRYLSFSSCFKGAKIFSRHDLNAIRINDNIYVNARLINSYFSFSRFLALIMNEMNYILGSMHGIKSDNSLARWY